MAHCSLYIGLLLLIISFQQFVPSYSYLPLKKITKDIANLCYAIKSIENFNNTKEDSLHKKRSYEKLLHLSTEFKDVKGRILNMLSDNLRSKLSAKIDKLFKRFNYIQRFYKIFLNLFENHGKHESMASEAFEKVYTSYNLLKIQRHIQKMHEIFAEQDSSIIDTVINDANVSFLVSRPGIHQDTKYTLHSIY